MVGDIEIHYFQSRAESNYQCGTGAYGRHASIIYHLEAKTPTLAIASFIIYLFLSILEFFDYQPPKPSWRSATIWLNHALWLFMVSRGDVNGASTWAPDTSLSSIVLGDKFIMTITALSLERRASALMKLYSDRDDALIRHDQTPLFCRAQLAHSPIGNNYRIFGKFVTGTCVSWHIFISMKLDTPSAIAVSASFH